LKAGGLFAPISREGALVLNNLLLVTACATVFLGTLYPLFLDALDLGKVSVGAPYFNATFIPIMTPLVMAMAVGPMLAWKRGDIKGVIGRLKFALGVGMIVTLGAWYAMGGQVLAAAGIGLAAWLVLGSLMEFAGRIKLFRIPFAASLSRLRHLPRSAFGMTIAHAALGIVVAGITASSAWQTEKILVMTKGDRVELASYSFVFAGVEETEGPNYTVKRGTFEVTLDGRDVATLTAERRFYPVRNMTTTEAAIHTTWFADLYAVVGDADEKGGWTVRLYHNPLVPWIWVGAVLMALGGLVSLTDRRHRVGAPARTRKTAARTKPPGGGARPATA
ncbi:MAG: cytochrome c-type biogenesis CcmF C-terminal domain-containing protein, partial [Alphaproteobacteria bacterium]